MLPSSKAPHAIVYYVHGYGSHCNRPTYVELFERLLSLGVSVIAIDLEGHGYSSGLRAHTESDKHDISHRELPGTRCSIPDAQHLVDDIAQLVELVTSGGAVVSADVLPKCCATILGENANAPADDGTAAEHQARRSPV